MRAAAQQLHLSAAAVSKGLREAEALFGAQIFHRLPHGVVLTPAGETVAQRARAMVNEVGHLADDLATHRDGAGDMVRLGAPPFLTWTLVPRVLQQMQLAQDLPRARIVEGRMGDICRQLEAGDIDMLVTMNMPSELGGLRAGGFVIEPVCEEQWTVVCAPAHPLAAKPPRGRVWRWEALLEQRWVLPPRPTAARRMIEELLLRRALPPIVPWIESMNAVTNLHLCAACEALTLAARGTLPEALALGTLVELPVEALPPPVAIALVYRTGSAGKPVVSALRAAVQRACNPATVQPGVPTPSRALSPSSPRRSRRQVVSSSVRQAESTGVATPAVRPRASSQAMPKGPSSAT